MSWLTRTLTSTSGRKMLAALTGLGLVLFLIIHLAGNLQIFSDSDAFNEYAKALHDGPLIIIGDVGLMIMFPLHIAMVIWLAMDNKKARGPVGYKASGSKQTRGFAAVLASKTTLYGGLLLLVFVALHVWQFRLQHDAIGYEVREAVMDTLAKPTWGAFYIIGSLLTGWHLFHGIQAAFRSLGVNHPRYTPLIVRSGLVLSIILGLGFAAIPAWILITA